MVSINDLRRLREAISQKIYLLVGRAIVTYVNNATSTQTVQLQLLSRETLSDVERVQPYGLETFPWSMRQNVTTQSFEGTDPDGNAEPEAIAVFQGGNRSNGVVILIGDRYYRLTDLLQGEVAIYTSEDKESGGHRVHLKSGQIVDIKGTEVTINCNVTVTGGDIVTDGNIEADGDVQDGSVTTSTMAQMRTTFNSHTHTHGDPAGTTSTPVPPNTM